MIGRQCGSHRQGRKRAAQRQHGLDALTGYEQSLRDLGIALGEALLASMPAYAEIYPTGIVRKVWPTELVEGESDAMRL